MQYVKRFEWKPEPGENVDHVARHGITTDEVEAVVNDPSAVTETHSGRSIYFGNRPGGSPITVVVARWDEETHYVVTARPMSKKERMEYL